MTDPTGPPARTRRPRYSGKNPRRFQDKYKELNPDRYGPEIDKVLASGKTPAGMHRPIMVDEVLACLRPVAGDVAVDCTLGGGGHTRALLGRVLPGGRVIGLDVDPIELPRTEGRLRSEGFGPESFVAHQGNFAGVHKALAAEGHAAANIIFADLGVSSMQLDNPGRGFSHKESGPLDMRMNPSRGVTAAQLIERLSEDALATLLEENADEPHAALIAGILKGPTPGPLDSGTPTMLTTNAVNDLVRQALLSAFPRLTPADATLSVRRTFQALRIAVNDEFAALDALLRSLPQCLAPGGRVAILTFHSGEDRRVKKAFQAGLRDGVYATVADEVIRATPEERRANPRASSAKLRWAVRS
ncbi:MAG TPA: 16S rRNA (cytosine(1402)-N(4))-methyltransferase RsmH [Vicinamibacterales bacterium]|nr:16S rRNA (cytosine(1402)-N(4))-methyltransferase RsmH [Vicinamibacterales bacterium]